MAGRVTLERAAGCLPAVWLSQFDPWAPRLSLFPSYKEEPCGRSAGAALACSKRINS